MIASMRTFFISSLFATALLVAQPQQQQLLSPIVHADRSVTFNLRAPNAQKVELSLDNGKRFPLAKDEKGIWTVKTPALDPDLHGYSFQVDGVGTIDPINGEIKSNALNPGSMVLVPGEKPQPWEFTDIPHGVIHRHFYHSKIVGENRDFFVYTPPGYQPGKRYALLVLLHGYSDVADGWTTVGKANLIFDQLIASGRRPFIAVMPLGYGMTQADLKARAINSGGNFVKNTVNFEKNLLEEVLPLAEKQYKVSSKAKERAISGLSMGGGETLYVGLRNLDKFSWIGAMSSAPQLMGKADEALAALSEKDNARIKLLWIAIGKNDFLLKQNQEFVGWLKTRKIDHKYIETEGAHTWLVWRRYLSDFLTQVNW
ncbi:MAG: esterase [Acidobacteria bacterium]|nr:esterase [Acidobacteriota bacterium]